MTTLPRAKDLLLLEKDEMKVYMHLHVYVCVYVSNTSNGSANS